MHRWATQRTDCQLYDGIYETDAMDKIDNESNQVAWNDPL